MFGSFIALGTAAAKLDENSLKSAWPSQSHCEIFTPLPDVTIARFTPPHLSDQPGTAWSDDKKLFLCVDGYVIVDGADSSDRAGQLKRLANLCREKGPLESLPDIAAGSYIIMAVDVEKRLTHVIVDPVSSLPLFQSRIEGGWMLTGSPVALARTGLISLDIDNTACAEWTLIAYTIGTRYPVRGIQTLRPGAYLMWDSNVKSEKSGQASRIWDLPLFETVPSPDEVADAFTRSLKRIESIEPHPAQLQSAGMDSRMILAAWPSQEHPPCYTYGDPDAHEVHLAKQIAAARGSSWHHVWYHGDDVAEELETMFTGGGIIKWPDRYMTGRRVAEDGYSGLLDGLLAGDLLGGRFYNIEAFFAKLGRISRFGCLFLDQKVSNIGIDRMAEAMYENIVEVPDPHALVDYVENDFVEMIRREKDNVLQDIYNDMKMARPENDSAALCWRNFLLFNRIPHMIVHEGLQCRQSVNVYLPYSNDRDFCRILMCMPPRTVRYHRFYRKIYRRRHPRFARIPYVGSLLPITRPAIQHKLSTIMVSQGKSIPLLTGKPNGQPRDPNSWGIWLHESPKMREFVRDSLISSGITDEKRCSGYFADVMANRKRGGGKLFHIASIGKWMAFSKKARANTV